MGKSGTQKHEKSDAIALNRSTRFRRSLAKAKVFANLVFLIMGVMACHSASAAHRILFVGNSFTGFSANALADFSKASPNGEDTLAFEYTGGINLQSHSIRAETLEAIRCGVWDYVVLQDHSEQPFVNQNSFRYGLSQLAKIVRDSGAKPILFETYARSQFGSLGNYLGLQSLVSNAYVTAGKDFGIPVARIGVAWKEIYLADRSLFNKLYKSDLIHPSTEGQFLIASAIYRTIHGTNLAWSPTLGLTSGEVSRIRSAVLSSNSQVVDHINKTVLDRCDPPVSVDKVRPSAMVSLLIE